ncbi:MAG: helix-turn-helix domain-containing protein [Acidobacteria bacterium]|nr:helix-turn-helix domain-containing protein [Acidobacteriota bacterium]
MNKTPLQLQESDKTESLRSLNVAAERWGVSIWTARAWAQAGKIETHKLGGRRLVSESEIHRLIESSRVPARADAQTKTATV